MVTMESAYYKGTLWCAYELKDSQGRYYEDYRLEMRKESQNHQFTCPECKEHLILCAGPIMEPFFKHHKDSDCTVRTLRGNGNYLVGRRLLYQLAKKSFPNSVISLHPKLNDTYYGGIMVDNNLSIELITYEMGLKELEEKMEFYKRENIVSVWIVSNYRYRKEFITTFEYLIEKYSSNTLKSLDIESSSMILKQRIPILETNGSKIISSEYSLEELTLMDDGEFYCDFQLICDREEEVLNREYRAILSLKEEAHKRKLAQVNEIRRENMKAYEESLQTKVIREKLADNPAINGKKMRMYSLGELWTLPDLTGTEREITIGNQMRYTYLKDGNKRIGDLLEAIKKEEAFQLIEDMVQYLERKKEAREWMYRKSRW